MVLFKGMSPGPESLESVNLNTVTLRRFRRIIKPEQVRESLLSKGFYLSLLNTNYQKLWTPLLSGLKSEPACILNFEAVSYRMIHTVSR